MRRDSGQAISSGVARQGRKTAGLLRFRYAESGPKTRAVRSLQSNGKANPEPLPKLNVPPPPPSRFDSRSTLAGNTWFARVSEAGKCMTDT